MKISHVKDGRIATLFTFFLALLNTANASNPHTSRHHHHLGPLHAQKRQDDQNDQRNENSSQCPFPRTRVARSGASPLITDRRIYEKYRDSSANYRQNSYPHLTDGGGAWQWVGADWWTSGFYPGTLYLLGERASMCPGSSPNADWVGLGRQWRCVMA